MPDSSRPHQSARWRRSLRSRASFTATLLATSLLLTSCLAAPENDPTVNDSDAADTAASAESGEEDKDVKRDITVAIDSFPGTLNPHLVGNYHLLVSTVADLTLPSVFVRKAGSSDYEFNRELMSKVEPQTPAGGKAPTAVTYVLQENAQWSDGTPISVADFQYLAEAIAKSDTANASALYRHIASIDTSSARNEFTVKFDGPLAEWRELFRHLLPSHIYRTEQRPFAEIMKDSLAASAGPYAVRNVDTSKGELELFRNDRYWGESPAKTDFLRFVLVPNLSTQMQMLRSGQAQVVTGPKDDFNSLSYSSLGYTQTREGVRHAQLSLYFNTESKRVPSVDARRAIRSLLNLERAAHFAVGTGAKPYQPSVLYLESPLPKENLEKLNTALSAMKDDTTPVKIAAVEDDEMAVRLANAVADRLRLLQVQSKVVVGNRTEVVTNSLPGGTADITVMWQPVFTSPSDYLAQFHCADTLGNAQETGEKDSQAGSDDAAQGSEALAQGGANVANFCNSEVDAAIDRMVSGRSPMRKETARIHRIIRESSFFYPVVPDWRNYTISTLVEGPDRFLDNWSTDIFTGIFNTAPSWTRKNEKTPPFPELGGDAGLGNEFAGWSH